MATFNVLIATVGRPSLQRQLDSLVPQLKEPDVLTIVFDGHATIPCFDLSKMKCKIRQYCEPIALGYWGHGIRNKYASLLDPTDFVMHADDDDIYTEDAFDHIRYNCRSNKLYVFLMKSQDNVYGYTLSINHVGTPCGIIPYEYNKQFEWGYYVGGDGEFYEKLNAKYASEVVYVSELIYIVKP
jgi:hypothetical protein